MVASSLSLEGLLFLFYENGQVTGKESLPLIVIKCSTSYNIKDIYSPKVLTHYWALPKSNYI